MFIGVARLARRLGNCLTIRTQQSCVDINQVGALHPIWLTHIMSATQCSKHVMAPCSDHTLAVNVTINNVTFLILHFVATHSHNI